MQWLEVLLFLHEMNHKIQKEKDRSSHHISSTGTFFDTGTVKEQENKVSGRNHHRYWNQSMHTLKSLKEESKFALPKVLILN